MAKIYKVMLNTDAVVCVIDAKDVVAEAARLHGTSHTATVALGRALIAGAFMASALKGDKNKLSVTIDGGGGLGKITVAGNNKAVRGFVTNPAFDVAPGADGKISIGEAVGREGTLTVIKDVGMKEPYVGKTELVNGEISEDFAYYFTVSEQAPSAVALGVRAESAEDGTTTVTSAGGVFVQPLPGCNDYVITMLEDIVTNFTDFAGLLTEKTPDEIIEYYFGAFELKHFDVQEIEYKCTCGKERMDSIIKSLGKNEVKDIVRSQGKVEIKCEFCSSVYTYGEDDVNALFGE